MAHQGGGIFSKFFSFFDATDKKHLNPDRITTTAWSKEVPYDLKETYRRKNSYLEERSFLIFVFPNSLIKGSSPTRLLLPFFEDPIIRERKQAKYATFNPIGRPSTLFAYMGAEARQFDVEFQMTLPNIVMFYNEYGEFMTKGTDWNAKKDLKNSFFEVGSPLQNNTTGPKAADYETDFLAGDLVVPIPFDYENRNALSPDGGRKLEQKKGSTEHTRVLRIMDVIRYWVDIVRSSCYNNTSDPSLGPPMVRLTHGILFRDLPCIVDSYDISFDHEVAGYHKESLLPRRIIISMSLKEIRAGDFGTFDVSPEATALQGDNLAGWEVIVDDFGGTLDPVPIRGI